MQYFISGWRSAYSAAIRLGVGSRLQPLRCLTATPPRGNTGHGCYFITACTFQKRQLLQSERMMQLFLDVLFHYRQQQKYLLHEFVLMPDHFHLLITPIVTLERAMQLIKGGFSFRAKRELGFAYEIWPPSYYDRRVRDAEEFFAFREYIRQNPVKKGLVASAAEYEYGSAWARYQLDRIPERVGSVEVCTRS
jgi:REP-associated tyrosine transposase